VRISTGTPRADSYRDVLEIGRGIARDPKLDLESARETLAVLLIAFRNCIEELAAHERERREG